LIAEARYHVAMVGCRPMHAYIASPAIGREGRIADLQRVLGGLLTVGCRRPFPEARKRGGRNWAARHCVAFVPACPALEVGYLESRALHNKRALRTWNLSQLSGFVRCNEPKRAYRANRQSAWK
jgi:hypothetical protein